MPGPEPKLGSNQIAIITVVAIIGLIIIVVYPNIPVSAARPDPCDKIGATYVGRGLCAKPDGSIWKVPT